MFPEAKHIQGTQQKHVTKSNLERKFSNDISKFENAKLRARLRDEVRCI